MIPASLISSLIQTKGYFGYGRVYYVRRLAELKTTMLSVMALISKIALMVDNQVNANVFLYFLIIKTFYDDLIADFEKLSL